MLRAAMRRAEGSHESPAGDHLAALAARSRSGAVLVVLAAALWSTGGVGVKVASGEPLVIAGLRSLFALLFMAAVIMVRRVPMRDVRGLLKRPLVWGAATSYALGLSSIGLRDYVIGTLAAMPALFGYVLLGTLADSGIAVWSSSNPLGGWMLALGACATLALTLRVGQLVARVIRPAPASLSEDLAS